MMGKLQTTLDESKKRMTLMTLQFKPLLGTHPPKPIKLVRATIKIGLRRTMTPEVKRCML